ncbi:MAG TPA: hypothetical protein VIM17_10065 [Jatrophihabitantaceae bacterium]|jgi:hypothetical protein
MTDYLGPLSDPAVRRERARRARAAQTTLDYHIKKLVDGASELSAEQRDSIAQMLHGDAP